MAALAGATKQFEPATKPFPASRAVRPKQSGSIDGSNRGVERRREASMNHSIYSADRTTHLKIVIVALVAGIIIAGVGVSARIGYDSGATQTAKVMKAGKPVVLTSSDASAIR
jgi:hypothetical protein